MHFVCVGNPALVMDDDLGYTSKDYISSNRLQLFSCGPCTVRWSNSLSCNTLGTNDPSSWSQCQIIILFFFSPPIWIKRVKKIHEKSAWNIVWDISTVKLNITPFLPRPRGFRLPSTPCTCDHLPTHRSCFRSRAIVQRMLMGRRHHGSLLIWRKGC